MQATEKALDHTFGDELQTSQLRDLQRVEQIETRAAGWGVRTVHAPRNVSVRHRLSQTRRKEFWDLHHVIHRLQRGTWAAP